MVNTNIRPTVPMLREVKLLQSFTEVELSKLITVENGITFEPHSNIVIEGELSWGLYLILEGTVGIFKTNKLTGDDYDIGQLKAGNFFGEMSLIDEDPRSATVRALVDTQVFFISKEAFNHLLANSGDLKLRFFENCVRTLVHRLRELDDNYVISQYQLWKSALKKEVA